MALSACAAALWIAAIPWVTSLGVMKDASQPSPNRPVRRKAASDRPPNQIGGHGVLHRLRRDRDVRQVIVTAVVGDVIFGPEAAQQWNRLIRTSGAL